MALGSLASLGIGGGVLTWDNLNQLKDQEAKGRIDPIKKKIEENTKQQTELTSLLTLMNSLNDNFKKLSDFSTYQQRSASVEGNGVKATPGEGLAIQDIKINVSQLAQNDVNQVGKKFSSRESVFSDKNSTLSFFHDGTNYNVNIHAGMSLSDVAQSITDATDGKVLGIIMKTGGDEPYQLMMNAKDTGAANKIYFGSTIAGAALPGGKIEKGTLEITIAGKTIKLDMQKDLKDKTAFGNDAKANAKAVVEALLDKINKSDSTGTGQEDLKDLKEKLESGKIYIGLNSAGTGIMINDSEGGDIKIETKGIKYKAADGTSEVETDLGFAKKEVDRPNQVTSRPPSSEKFSGTLIINNEKIKLDGLTENDGKNQLEQLVKKINETEKLKNSVEAKIENGRLVLNSKDGKDINISAEGEASVQNKTLSAIGLDAGIYASNQEFTKNLTIQNIQKAQDAKFTYNGIPIERDKNNIDDVVSGLSLELTAITETDKDVIVRISRDDEDISKQVEDFVKNFNEVVNKLSELTRYSQETNIAGPFQSNSTIKGILRDFNSIINSNDANGNNLFGFGISLNTKVIDGKEQYDGTLKFDKEKFEEAFKKDPDASIGFFRSATKTINGKEQEIDGVFTRLHATMNNYVSGDKSLLKVLETSLSDGFKKLGEEQKQTQKRLDDKYESLAERWSAYDQLLAKIQQKANSVSQIINQASK